MTTSDVSADYYRFWGIESSVFRKPYASPEHLFKDNVIEVLIRRICLTILNSPSFVWIEGTKGSGKSELSKYLYQTLPFLRYEVALLKLFDSEAIPLQEELAVNLDIDISQNDCLAEIIREGRRVIVILDSAEALSQIAIQRIVEVYDRFKDSISFLIFAQDAADGQGLIVDRLTSTFEIPTYDFYRMQQFIGHYLKNSNLDPEIFEIPSVQLIHQFSKGNPKRALMIAEQCLIEAYLENSHIVTASLVTTAVTFTGITPQNAINQKLDVLSNNGSATSIEMPTLDELLGSDQHSLSTNSSNQIRLPPVNPTMFSAKVEAAISNTGENERSRLIGSGSDDRSFKLSALFNRRSDSAAENRAKSRSESESNIQSEPNKLVDENLLKDSPSKNSSPNTNANTNNSHLKNSKSG